MDHKVDRALVIDCVHQDEMAIDILMQSINKSIQEKVKGMVMANVHYAFEHIRGKPYILIQPTQLYRGDIAYREYVMGFYDQVIEFLKTTDLGYQLVNFKLIYDSGMFTITPNGGVLRAHIHQKNGSLVELETKNFNIRLFADGLENKIQKVAILGEQNGVRALRKWIRWNLIHETDFEAGVIDEIYARLKKHWGVRVALVLDDGRVVVIDHKEAKVLESADNVAWMRISLAVNGFISRPIWTECATKINYVSLTPSEQLAQALRTQTIKR